jgi:hypothetical protein
MTRDCSLERTLRADLAGQDRLTETGMFGGWAFMVRGHLLVCARHDGMLVRLGRSNDAWALALPGAAALLSRSRPMAGWVHIPPDLCTDPALRRRLLDASLGFVAGLPPKPE